LLFTTNTKANSAYVDHPKQHGRFTVAALLWGEPKEKGYVLRGGSWGFLNRPLQGLELLRIFPFVFFWVVTIEAKSEDRVFAFLAFFDTSIDFSSFFRTRDTFGKRK